MNTISKLGLAALVVIATSAVASADAGEILKAHFKAVGGLDNLSAIKTVKRSAKLELGGALTGLEGSIEEMAVIGKKSYTSSDFGIGKETTAWNGTIGWKDGQEGLVELDEGQLEFAKMAVFVDPLQGIYEQIGASAFTQGEDKQLGGKDCATLKIVVVGDEVKFYIDKESHHVVGFEIPTVEPPLGETTILITYGDYAKFGDVMLPNSVKMNIAEGMITIDYTYEKTEFDLEIDEEIFEKP